MSLVRTDLTFDRSAIMVFAWREHRTANCSRFRRPFGECLAYAWRLARAARDRKADGTAAREAAEAAARVTAAEQFRASLTDEQRAASDAWLVRSCSTDGRVAL